MRTGYIGGGLNCAEIAKGVAFGPALFPSKQRLSLPVFTPICDHCGLNAPAVDGLTKTAMQE
jgi:hypothetical protein